MILLLLLLFSGCVITEVVDAPMETKADTTSYQPRENKDTTERKPIVFGVSIEDWEEANTESYGIR